MNDRLRQLIEAVRHRKMTPDEVDAQRLSFAYGNVKLRNPDVTWEMIDEAATRLRERQEAEVRRIMGDDNFSLLNEYRFHQAASDRKRRQVAEQQLGELQIVVSSIREHLGIRDTYFADEVIAVAILDPIVRRIEELKRKAGEA